MDAEYRGFRQALPERKANELSTPPHLPSASDAPAIASSPAELHAPNITPIESPGGPGRVLTRILLGVLVTSLLVGSYLYFGKRKALATGDVSRIQLYPIHSVQSGSAGTTPGMAGQDETYDQLIVFAQVHVHNQSTEPLTILELQGNVTEPDAAVVSSLAASANDSERLFGAYPKLAPLRMDLLLRKTTIAPGQTGEGMLIFNYSMTKEQWEQKKSFNVAVTFTNGAVVQFDGTRL